MGSGGNRLADKVAVITGGSGGIGKGVALRFATEGACVVLSGRSADRATAVIQEIEALGGRGHFVAGDVRSLDDMHRLMAETEETFGGVDIVVANAGANDNEARQPEVRGPFATIDLTRVTNWVAESLAGKLLVVQAAVPCLAKRGGGSVIFVTSEGGRTPTPGQTGISAFSAGLIQVGKLLSKELARDQIRVNTVAVTVVRDSPSWTAAFETTDGVSAQHRRQYEKIIERAPFGVANPTEIGDVVTFLASKESHYLTGTVLSPTGGLTLY